MSALDVPPEVSALLREEKPYIDDFVIAGLFKHYRNDRNMVVGALLDISAAEAEDWRRRGKSFEISSVQSRVCPCTLSDFELQQISHFVGADTSVVQWALSETTGTVGDAVEMLMTMSTDIPPPSPIPTPSPSRNPPSGQQLASPLARSTTSSTTSSNHISSLNISASSSSSASASSASMHVSDFVADFYAFSEENRVSEPHTQCCLCQKAGASDLFCPQNCAHLFCRGCLQDHLSACVAVVTAEEANRPDGWYPITASTIGCPAKGCDRFLAAEDVRTLLPTDQFTRLVEFPLQRITGSSAFVTCPSCAKQFLTTPSAVEPSNPISNGPQGQRASVCIQGTEVSVAAKLHFDQFRLRCLCGVDFCTGCKRSPYHLGFSCEEAERRQLALPCRFCGSPVEGDNAQANSLVCDSAECRQRAQEVCSKTLPCGHLCCGVKNEDQCPPCLVKDCPAHLAAKATNKLHQTGEDLCTICHVEELKAAPCVQLACSHVFHCHCVLQKLEGRWPTPRISFGFLDCPTCKAEISAPRHGEITRKLTELNEFRQDLRRRARQRLEYEGRHTDKDITDPSKPFKNDPTLYAEYLLSYYPCYKCKKPYFGGIRVCDPEAGGGGGGGADQAVIGEFNPEELVCGGCVAVASGSAGAANGPCAKHGSDYLAYKCRYCCSAAVWFCHGTTHYCDPCHRLCGKKRQDHPQCGGPASCPLGIAHPPHGTEHCLGCVVCNGIKGC